VFHTLNELAKQGVDILFTPQKNPNISTQTQIESFYGEKIHPNLTIRFLPQNKLIQSFLLRLHILREGLRGSFIYCRKLGWMPYVNFISRGRNAVEIHKLSTKHVQAAQKAAHIVTISHPLKEHLISENIDPNKITVIGSGFSSNFSPLQQSTDDDRHRLVYFGKLTADKGVDLIIQALQYVDCEALIIGGEYDTSIDRNRKRLNDLVNQLGVSERVQFTGFVTQKEIPSKLRRGDIGVIPTSPQDTQGICNSPLKLFEYLALGLPCIATDMPAFTSIQNRGKAIKYFQAGNPEALAEKVKEIDQVPDCYDLMSDAAIDTSKEYTWAERAKKIITLISAS
jgi:glycosyltransferase involved in cell wall biosynthesis